MGPDEPPAAARGDTTHPSRCNTGRMQNVWRNGRAAGFELCLFYLPPCDQRTKGLRTGLSHRGTDYESRVTAGSSAPQLTGPGVLSVCRPRLSLDDSYVSQSTSHPHQSHVCRLPLCNVCCSCNCPLSLSPPPFPFPLGKSISETTSPTQVSGAIPLSKETGEIRAPVSPPHFTDFSDL